MAANTAPHNLNYSICTPSELRGFVRDRRNLNPAESEGLKNYHKSHLVACLESLDRNATFRFGDLAAEIRLEVYRHLLVGRNNDDRHAPDRTIETAILRTCKAVYIEAEPVLYTENRFTVAINFKAAENTQDKGVDSSACIHYHYISITRPGHSNRYLFYQDDDFADQRERLSDKIASNPCFNMLRRVRNLDIFGNCIVNVQEVITALCMMLSGRARIKTLRFILLPSHAGLDGKELAKICWPLAFVNVPVKFWFGKQDVAVSEKLHKVTRDSYVECQAWRRLVASYPQSGPRAPGDLVAVSRAPGRRTWSKSTTRIGAICATSMPW